jgi:uncharacterized OB-fold protein
MARILPSLDGPDAPFWTSGRDGALLVARCEACDRWVHPATERCEVCECPLTWAPVSGRGTVLTFTVNHQPFNPEVPVPYVIAIVTLDEQDDLRVPTNIVDCEPDAVVIGMPVTVRFEQHGEVWFPLFAPVHGS